MRGRRVFTTIALGAFVGLSIVSTAGASSHREAPFIAKNPKDDASDFYMFNSYEAGRSGYVTILANYQPLQAPYGGPNFYAMDDDALYEIEIDNVGDGHEHITFQFQFSDPLPNGGTGLTLPVGNDGGVQVAVPFLNLGPITAANQATTTNRNETYTVTMVAGDRRTGTATPITAAGSSTTTSFQRPVDYIGNTSFGTSSAQGSAAAYETYARQFINNVSIPGCTPPVGTTPRVWVGQRQEPFAVNLGVVFDLLDNTAPGITGVLTGGSTTASNGGANPIGGFNVTTIALEVPASCLTGTGGTTIGGWTTSSVRQARVINPAGTYATPTKEGGAWAQISRLGMPLVNELVIGLKDKDTFNASAPSGDGQFATYVTNPTLSTAIEALFGPTIGAPDLYPRADLEAVFLTGVKGVNQVGTTPVASEMLRLNTGIPATPATGQKTADGGPGGQSSLGALNCFVQGGGGTPVLTNPGCDPAGFPNGRRPGDDVVDVALRVVEGYLLPAPSVAPVGNVAWSDGVMVDDSDFQLEFPYFQTPNGG